MYTFAIVLLVMMTSSCSCLLYSKMLIQPYGLLEWLPNYFPSGQKWQSLLTCATCLSGWLTLLILLAILIVATALCAVPFHWIDLLFVFFGWTCTPVLTIYINSKTFKDHHV